MIPSLRHEQLAEAAAKLIGGKWQQYAFRTAVNAALYESGEHSVALAGCGCPHNLPDRYQIDDDSRSVRILEVGNIDDWNKRCNLLERTESETPQAEEIALDRFLQEI